MVMSPTWLGSILCENAGDLAGPIWGLLLAFGFTRYWWLIGALTRKAP